MTGDNSHLSRTVIGGRAPHYNAKAEEIEQILTSYMNAGAKIIDTPTAELHPFAAADSVNLCESLARLTRKAAGSFRKTVYVSGTLGSSNALIDPFGKYSFTELISAYDAQVKSLDSYVDMFTVEQLSTMSDLRAALLSCNKTEKPVFVTVKIDDDCLIVGSEIPVLAALITAQEMGANAFGISGSSPEITLKGLTEIAGYAKIPLIAKPSMNGFFEAEYLSYFDKIAKCGAVYLGGICGSETLSRIKAIIARCGRPAKLDPKDDFFIFTFEKNIFFLEPDTTEISEPIDCQPDMEEIIVEACRENIDILRVQINSADDAIDFARNAHMSSLPVMFSSENDIALRMALMLYQGLAMIDSETEIPRNALEEMCKKYGAVIY